MSFCRTCLKIPAEKNIFELQKDIQDDDKKCIDIMKFCLDIKVSHDSKITTNLCTECHIKIISFYNFKVLSLKNDSYLKSLDIVIEPTDEKLSFYVDENGVRYGNPFEPDEFGPQLVEDPHTEINNQVIIKNEYALGNIVTEDVKLRDKETLVNIGTCTDKQDTIEDNASDEVRLSEKQNVDHKNVRKQAKRTAPQCKKRSPKKKQTQTATKRKHQKANIGTQTRQTCKECGMSVLDLKSHSLSHMPKDQRPTLKCKACPKLFFSRGGRRRHYKIRHLGQKPKCDLCNKEVVHLSVHMLQVHNPGELRFGCETCERRFVSQPALNSHMLTHSKNIELPFECDDCDKKYRTKNHLTVHKRQVHLKIRDYFCDICSQGFFYRVHLEDHIRSHTKERPFPCEECGKSFGSKTTLKAHRVVHTDVRNYKCEYCDMGFKTTSAVKSHTRKHLEKSYSCQYCGKRFGRPDSCRRHEAGHRRPAASETTLLSLQ